MANENQKRHLRGAPASMGGKYAPEEKADSGRKIFGEKMSNLLNERNKVIEETARIEEEMESEDCTPERFDELQNELASVESSFDEIYERIGYLTEEECRPLPVAGSLLPKPDLSDGVREHMGDIERVYCCSISTRINDEYTINGNWSDFLSVEEMWGINEEGNYALEEYELRSLVSGVPETLITRDPDRAAEYIQDWCSLNLDER